MRPSHLTTALFAAAANLTPAQGHIAVRAGDATDCECSSLTPAITSSTTTLQTPPTPTPTTTITATYIDNLPSTDVALSTAWAVTGEPPFTLTSYAPGNATTATASSSTTTGPAVVSSNVATPGEPLAGDSSILGLVVFFALSLCLL